MTILRRQLARFAVVGAVSTVVHLGLFALVHLWWPEQAANVVALSIATVVNTALNRTWTFDVHQGPWVAHQAQAFAIFAATWAATSGGLALLHRLVSDPPLLVEIVALGLSTAGSAALRFAVMRRWTHTGIPAPATRATPATPAAGTETAKGALLAQDPLVTAAEAAGFEPARGF